MVVPEEIVVSWPLPCGLVVGNHCHDVVHRNGVVISEGLGGATSFISNILDGLSMPCTCVSKVGSDFIHEVPHTPILCANSPTTLFHADFDGTQDRVLRLAHACDPIFPSDLPASHFDYGLAVGVAGEISPQTLSAMLDICRVVFVDAQALIRRFDPVDGAVGLVPLRETDFCSLLPRIGFLKASEEEAPFVNIQEARKYCCVVVTEGPNGCRIYSRSEEFQVPPFSVTEETDPTGAGDSFLAGFAAGIVRGLSIPQAALLGNFFGSLTVAHLGIPKFHKKTLQILNDKLKIQQFGEVEDFIEAKIEDVLEFDDFHDSLRSAADLQSFVCEGH